MALMQPAPIEVFYWSTPNGRKVTVTLEELGVPYVVEFIDIRRREQWTDAFGEVSPNHQIPAIRDPAGPGGAPIAIFESGAILLYLARKFGRLYPAADERLRVEVEQWLFWQMASFGPFLGQAHHFNFAAADEVPYAIERYAAIARRLYAVLDHRLADREHVAGAYSIADIAIFCWAARHQRHRIDLGDYPNVQRWFDSVRSRPAVDRGMAIMAPGHVDPFVTGPAWAKQPAGS